VEVAAVTSQFTAYFDDSGHPDDQPAVTVAGFISTAEQWHLLANEWEAALAAEGVGSGIFHMTDFVAGRGEYERWSADRKKMLLDKLICIIRTRTRMSFSAIVPMNVYKHVNQIYALEESLGRPYAIAGRTVVAQLNAWSKKYNHSSGGIEIVFEQGAKHSGDLLDVFQRDGFQHVSFKGKGEVVALQAADLLAWESINAYKKGPKIEIRSSFDALLEHPFDHGAFTMDDLKAACEKARAPLRKDAGPNPEISFHSLVKKIRKRTI